MNLFNKDKDMKPDVTIKIKMCKQHLDFCKQGRKTIDPFQVVTLLRLMQNCRECKVVIE